MGGGQYDSTRILYTVRPPHCVFSFEWGEFQPTRKDAAAAMSIKRGRARAQARARTSIGRELSSHTLHLHHEHSSDNSDSESETAGESDADRIRRNDKSLTHVDIVIECRNAEDEVAIRQHCRNNMVHNRIRENGFLAATVPSSAWPLILKEFSDMPDVLYYLLQHKHGAMVCPTRQCCKRKQDFD
jgi:hypothetical protein